jgi:oxygen-independent coproporphyrinogen-3 oxidase
LTNTIGLYLHIPFCRSKCSYCDFYSFNADEITVDKYTETLKEHIKVAGKKLGRTADTLYFGGGTPSLLGGDRIADIVNTAKQSFVLENAEITVEVNPADDLYFDLKKIADAGVNRISLGVQSYNENELTALSRRHNTLDVIRTVNDAKKVGIENISADLMLGIPHQTIDSLKESLEFTIGLGVTHISCYILKIEQGTPLHKKFISAPENLSLPSDDLTADMYLYMSKFLENKGFSHYEISNFAMNGFNSRHNLKYWNCEEYLGIGPSAHSFLNGNRFYFERSLNKYLNSPTAIPDGSGGDSNEYIMLRLRLKDGLIFSEFRSRFGRDISPEILKKAKSLENSGLVTVDSRHISLTTNGFLLSNTVIGQLLA